MNESKITSYRDLIVWQKAMKLVIAIYEATNHFPKSELYTLTSQIRRAAISIPSNIAEGFTRRHNKEYKQFLYVALGSCAELETKIEISSNLNFITSSQKENLLEKTNHFSRMITNLIKCL